VSASSNAYHLDQAYLHWPTQRRASTAQELQMELGGRTINRPT